MSDLIDNNWNGKLQIIEKCNYFLILILPISLITGPFFPDLIAVLIALSFIFLTLIRKEYYFYKNVYLYFFLIWCVILIISSLLSNNILFSFESSLFHFRFGFFALGIWYFLQKNNQLINKFTNYITITFIIILIDAYIQYFLGYNTLGFIYKNNRLSGFFGEELILGSYLSRLLPLLFSLIFIRQNTFKVTLGMLILIATDVLIYISGERTAFLYLLIATISILILCKNLKLIRLFTFVLSLLIILLITFTNQGVRVRMVQQTLDQAYPERESVKLFSTKHEAMFTSSMKMFKDNFIFGIGPKMYRKECSNKEYSITILDPQTQLYKMPNCDSHPHNTYMQLLAETGLVGTMPVIFVFLLIVYLFIRQLISLFMKNTLLNDHQVCLIIAIFISVWPFAPGGNFFNNWLNVIFFMPVGFLLYSFYSQNYKNPNV